MSISITTIRLVQGQQLPSGSVMLAFFDVRLEGIADIRGCVLVDNGPNGMNIWAPPCDRKANEPERGIKFTGATRKAIIRVATQAYKDFIASREANTVTVSAAVALLQELERREAA